MRHASRWELADPASAPVTHIPLCATTVAWSKECPLNVAIGHLLCAAEKSLPLAPTLPSVHPATETLAALALFSSFSLGT
jgi:hypothetical protein